mmetsp:Transcript_1879/g.7825  ORF Transcript_1879/g.7825 Transcript_1879/m.7825 type:complete len:371 (+) Transcript_1879:590-1702(+)
MSTSRASRQTSFLLLTLVFLRIRVALQRLLDGRVVRVDAGQRRQDGVDVVGIRKGVRRARAGRLVLTHGHRERSLKRGVVLPPVHHGVAAFAAHGQRERALQQRVLVHHRHVLRGGARRRRLRGGRLRLRLRRRGGGVALGVAPVGRRRRRLLARALLLERDAQREHERRVVPAVHHVPAVEALHGGVRRRRRRRRGESASPPRVLVHEDGRAEQHVREVGARRHGHQVAVVVLVHRAHERLELLGVLVDVAEAHHVHGDVALAQLLAHGNQLARLRLHGRADEQHDAHALVLVLAVLERQVRHLDPGGEVHGSFHGDAVHGVEHHAQVVGGGDEHPGHLSGQAEHAHAVFGVGLRLRPREQVDGVRLSL